MAEKKDTQKKRVLAYLLEHGSITLDISWAKLGCQRLSDVILRLRHKDGFNIKTEMVQTTNQFGEPCEYAKYVLVP